MDKLSVVKIGGNVIENRRALAAFLNDFAALEGSKIIVHGGGKEATLMAQQLGIPVQMIDGRRVTDAATLDLITMVYGGKINKTIVAQLQALGCNALGFTGADGNSITALKRSPQPVDFGFVGDVSKVETALLKVLFQQGITPVFCAITHDGAGQLLNTNADTVAASLAKALATDFEVQLMYCFEKKGVLENVEDNASVLPKINAELYEKLKQENKIHSGMLPKLHNCFDALQQGVKHVFIGDAEMIRLQAPYTQIEL
ncbi:acetylglutamate kinase [Flavobacteriaceae bacterium]|jgi:acetylglutamate kinase|nr:acetylglutamate kinase [Flavobacteriaceae bacterium]MDA7711118.1 acetylglutamate kinase [Flavobacteriaceae bacterium]MDA8993308.1 acetylglutamate kinase [Flavobacteriaceae bacterium]